VKLAKEVTRELGRIRRDRKVTQEQLAELLDVPVQHVSRIEAGQNITLATLERICLALGVLVKVSFVMSGKPKKPPLSQRQKTKRNRSK
jgi:transcriptional regulator with XRE-family HTH domain